VWSVFGTAALTTAASSSAEFALTQKDGKEWVIEVHGVDPDIVVDNDHEGFAVKTRQLNRAIEEIQKDMKTKVYVLPPVPPFESEPDARQRSRRVFLHVIPRLGEARRGPHSRRTVTQVALSRSAKEHTRFEPAGAIWVIPERL